MLCMGALTELRRADTMVMNLREGMEHGMNPIKIDDILQLDFAEGTHFQGDYAVLVPLLYVDDTLHFLFQVRSMTLKRQPGEVGFPGGRIELNELPSETALREMHEEMNIAPEAVHVIGELERIVNMSSEIIYPCLGFVENKNPDDIRFNEEVDEVFTVPVTFFMENKPTEYYITYQADEGEHLYAEEALQYSNKLPDTIVRRFYSYRYGRHNIWGLTARIVYDIIQQIQIKGNSI